MNPEIDIEVYKEPEAKSIIEKFRDSVIDCINNGFGQEMPEDEVESAIAKEIVILGFDSESDQVVAFGSLEKLNASRLRATPLEPDLEGIYLDAAVIRRDFQGQGLYKQMLDLSVSEVVGEKLQFIACFTQNPAIEYGLSSSLNRLVEAEKLGSFLLHRIKREGLYQRRLTPYSLNTAGTPFEELDLEAGDAFLLIFGLEY